MQRVVRGNVVELEAEFTDGLGRLVDPPDVRCSVIDYDDVEQVSNAVPTRLAQGRYAFSYRVPEAGSLGAWRIRWDATISGAPAGGVEAFDVVAAGAVTPGGPGWLIVSPEEVAAYGGLGGPSQEVHAALAAHVQVLTATLERRLHKPLSVREFVDTVVVGDDGRCLLTWHPVVSVAEVLASAAFGFAQPWMVPGSGDPEMVRWTPGTVLQVRYRAGIDGAHNAAVRAAVLTKALPYAQSLYASQMTQGDGRAGGGGLVVPAPVAGVKSFSVEGLQVGYESQAESSLAALRTARAAAEATAWSDAEVAALAMRRPVVA